MGLLDKLRGELIDIIEWVDDSKHTLVWRFPRYQTNQILRMDCRIAIASFRSAPNYQSPR